MMLSRTEDIVNPGIRLTLPLKRAQLFTYDRTVLQNSEHGLQIGKHRLSL